MSISERLKSVIDAKFSTLKGASEFTGIPYRSLQSYVSGKQSPGSEALVTLHKTLRVDLNWLLTGEENSWPTTEDRKEVCVNLMEYIEMEFEAESGTKPYCGDIATIYNRVLHHKGVEAEPWDNVEALKRAVKYEVLGSINMQTRIKRQLGFRM